MRERLESIVLILEPRLQSSTLVHDAPLAGGPQNCPPLVIKSPHLMQILGLPKDLASVLYRLEIAAPQTAESPVEWTHSSSPEVYVLQICKSKATQLTSDSILLRFQDQVHRWCPVLHHDFTRHFVESNAAGFPYSQKSCLSLLVASLASLDDYRSLSSHYKAAQSMIPIVIQESSVTSVQCLVLFSIYCAVLLQPRQAYEYIQAASLKLQPLLNSPYFAEGSPELHLLSRLYWTIHLIESEISMHFALPCMGKTMHSQLTKTPLPTCVDAWNYSSGSSQPSTPSSSAVPLSRDSPVESPQMFSRLSTELNLQLILNNYASSVTDMRSCYNDGSLHVENTASPGNPLDPLPALASTCKGSDSPNSPHPSQHMDDPVCQAKSHLYEAMLYWPVIYRVIMDGSADHELLPYASLFFESVISFLGAARIAIRVCPLKAWFFGASVYIVSVATIKALEVQFLRLLAPPRTWEYLKGSVDALHRPSQLSPSVQYMRDSLKERLEMAKLQNSD
ncbi:hypothetical protein KXW24_008053 [Aspergillus fumigatus]|nr:hypothetical protein KXW24_008053 [Aspergillus fumigatus]